VETGNFFTYIPPALVV